MSGYIPIDPGDPEQRIEITLDEYPVVMRVRWNTRANDDAGLWFLDIYEADNETPIATGLALVLGVLIGNRTNHRIFEGALFLYDESGTGAEAGLQDLGGRVKLVYLTPADRDLAGAPMYRLSELPP